MGDGAISMSRIDLPLSCNLDAAGNALAGNTFTVRNAEFLANLATLRVVFAGAVLLVDSSLLAVEAVFFREAGFVTFPSDAQSLVR